MIVATRGRGAGTGWGTGAHEGRAEGVEEEEGKAGPAVLTLSSRSAVGSFCRDTRVLGRGRGAFSSSSVALYPATISHNIPISPTRRL